MEYTKQVLMEAIKSQELVHLLFGYMTPSTEYQAKYDDEFITYTRDVQIGGLPPSSEWVTLDHVDSRNFLMAEIKELEYYEKEDIMG